MRQQRLGMPTSSTPHSALRTPRSALRPAFTLVELLVVVIIISILMALLLPAIQNARRGAQEAKVIIEIKQLESAIAAFKVTYGVEPPSRIRLYKTQAGWDSNAESKAIIKRIWPQFDFGMTGGAGVAYPGAWGAANNNPININSGECLMFFLGGIMQNYPANSVLGFGAPVGFAKNPALPFSPTATSRQAPFLEFDVGRIRDTDKSGMPEFVDSLPNQTQPYLYLSSYESSGYRSTDLPVVPPGTMLDVYRTNNTTATPGPSTQSLPAQRPQSFQIISPGFDNSYGLGGVFNPSISINAGLQNQADFDNLTNFHGGRLNP